MAVKIGGFDQVTAWIAGLVLSCGIFASVWYLGKWIGARQDAEQTKLVESAERHLGQRHLTDDSKSAKNDEGSEHKSENESGKPPKAEPLSTLESWGYTGQLAPWNWTNLNDHWKLCGHATNQSPIDINGAKSDEDLKTLKFNYTYGVTHITLHHDTVQGDIDQGSYLNWDGERFDLKHFYARTPSEHRVNGLPWEMEIQLEHQSITGQVIMVSVFVTSGPVTSFMTTLASDLPRYKDEQKDHGQITWIDLLPNKKLYWTYEGSGTIPPCAPKVLWILLTEPITASKSVIDHFVTLQKNNVRPTFDLGHRQLRRSQR